MRDDLPGQRVQRHLTVGIRDVDQGALRRAHVIADLEAGADHDAAHALRLEGDPIRFDVLFDHDSGKKLARRRIGRAAGNPLGPDLDGRRVHAFDVNPAVGVDDANLSAGGSADRYASTRQWRAPTGCPATDRRRPAP